MTKQEKIREEIKINLKAFGCTWGLIGNTDPEDIATEYAEIILTYLHSQGAVLKGASLGFSHPHLTGYFTVTELI